MVDISPEPLPLDFYKQEAWANNLVEFYGKKEKLLPVKCLKNPVEKLTKAMDDIIYIYGNFPDIVHDALGQCIDPTFEPEEYYNKIYKFLMDAAKRDNLKYIITYADALLTVRLLFTRDKKFYEDSFECEIEVAPGESAKSKYETFGTAIQKITKVHVNQVRKIISERS